MTLPTINSYRLIGDETICSIVPCSFSLTIVNAVSTVPTIIMITAMMPGTTNWTLSMFGLNQTRGSISIAGIGRFNCLMTDCNWRIMMSDENCCVMGVW